MGRRNDDSPDAVGVERPVGAAVVSDVEAVPARQVEVDPGQPRLGVVGHVERRLQAPIVVVSFPAGGRRREAGEPGETHLARRLELLLLVGDEVECPITDQRTAQGAAELVLGRRRVLAERVLRRELLGPQQVERRPVDGVRPRLGDGVDEPAGRPAELGRVARLDDPELADRVLGNGEGELGALAAPDTAEKGLVVIGSVDADVAVDAALPGQRDLPALRLDLRRRRQGDEIVEPPPIDRQVGDGLPVERHV